MSWSWPAWRFSFTITGSQGNLAPRNHLRRQIFKRIMLLAIWSFSSWDWVDISSTGLVVIGCIGEIWVFFIKEPFNPTNCSYFESHKKRLIEVLSACVLTIGVIGELIALPKSLKEISDLNENNLVLRSNVAALEIRVQPRRITENQHAKLVAKLRQVIKGPVAVRWDWTDAEAQQFGLDIRSVLADAAFEIRDDNAQILSMNDFGAFMFTLNVTNPPSHARPIQQSFMDTGIDLDGKNAWQGGKDMEKSFESTNSNLVLIWVSQKP
jgi:hypothetical protein